jgi:peptidoglycan/LPS O-acetylase OafA/YrhL
MSALAYRRDIDGLRAVAVLSVVIYHAFPALIPGGFIGVDIFFVISGYLISTLIFKGFEAQNFSYLDFYTRRIRRIFPTLVLVLLFCLIFGWVYFVSEEFLTLCSHIFYGSLFSSNYILYKSIGYFDNLAELKPLLHLWSLAIEEQFYIIWPLAMGLLWRLKRFKLSFIVITALISFVLNVYFVRQSPSLAFYTPFTRFWELQIGCALAYATLYHPAPLRKVSADIQAVLGFLLIIAALIFVNKTRYFPGFWALLPTFGAALLINAGLEAKLNRLILANRSMVFVGLISYPLYLWHWPLLSFNYTLERGAPLVLSRLFILAVSFLFAYLSYRYVEKFLRFGGHKWVKTIGLSSLMLVIAVTGWYGVRKIGFPQRFEKPLTQGMSKRLYSDLALCPLGAEAALLSDMCAADRRATRPADIALVGDSHAITLYDGFLTQARPADSVALIAHFECSPLRGVVQNYSAKCLAFNVKALENIAQNPQFKTIVLQTFYKQMSEQKFQLVSDTTAKLSQEDTLTTALADTVSLFLRQNKRVVFVIDNPAITRSPLYCQERHFLWMGKKPHHQCEITREAHEASLAPFRKIIANVQKLHPAMLVIDPTDILCTAQKCGMKSPNGWDLYSYTEHLSDYAAAQIALLIQEALK